MKRFMYISGIAFIILSACVKEEEELIEELDIPVVEAFLEPGREVSVSLSKMLPYTEEEYTGSLIIDDAQIYMGYKGVDYLLTAQSNKPGTYKCLDSNLVVEPGVSYNLFFEYNEAMVSSLTTIPHPPNNATLNTSILKIDTTAVGPGATQNPMVVSWDNLDNAHHLVMVEYLESSYVPISSNLSSDMYYQFRKVATEPVAGNTYNLNTRQHIVFFGKYRVLIYKVNKEYVDLYENVSQSSQNLTEPLTNIENGVGIFTGMSADTLLLEVKAI